MISAGRVAVNGHILDRPGYDVQPGDVIEVDGREISPEKEKIYILLNKPTGYVTTTSDEEGRPTVLDLVPDFGLRIFPVGRLDMNTSGLLILTNDGDLTKKLTHPSHEFVKTYKVRAAGTVGIRDLEVLRRGVDIGGFVTSPAEAEILNYGKNSTVLEVKIHEGKNRQVRRMFRAIGHPVTELERKALGNIKIGSLPRGGWRRLRKEEIEYLKSI